MRKISFKQILKSFFDFQWFLILKKNALSAIVEVHVIYEYDNREYRNGRNSQNSKSQYECIKRSTILNILLQSYFLVVRQIDSIILVNALHVAKTKQKRGDYVDILLQCLFGGVAFELIKFCKMATSHSKQR